MKRPDLSDLDLETFARTLRRACRRALGAAEPESPFQKAPSQHLPLAALADAVLVRLHAHYQELRRWNRGLSLIGPGTVDEVMERHYGESLAGLSLLPPLRPDDGRPAILVDLGSGAGFPGWILAAARPDLHSLLVEARGRKGAFLRTVTNKARARTPDTALPIQVLDARVEIPLPRGIPEQIDAITTRALKLEPEWLEALSRRLAPAGRLLLWLGDEVPCLPEGWKPTREVALSGSDRRRILEVTLAR